MRNKKIKLRNIIHKVINEDRDALKDTLEHTDPEDVAHGVHDTWEGGEKSARWATDDDQKAPEQGNLVQPVDRAKSVTGIPSTREIEVLDHATGKVVKRSDRVFDLNEADLRKVIRNIIGEYYR